MKTRELGLLESKKLLLGILQAVSVNSEVLNRVKVDIVAGQETWEGKDKVVNVDGSKWFGKPRIDQNNHRGEGGVGFLVRECIVEEVEFIRDFRHEEGFR